MPSQPTEPTIIVRDRRQVHQFSIHNSVIDNWLPIIGQTGFLIYALYVRMSNHVDERCYPGYTMISRHLCISRSTLSRHNALLQWSRLIYVQPGDRHTANTYFILDIPPVNPEALHHIRTQATSHLQPGSPFLRTIIRRLSNYRPISELWYHARPAPQILRPGQPRLFDPDACESRTGVPPVDHPSPPVEHPSTPVEHPSTRVEQGVPPGYCNNPNQQSEQQSERNNPQQQHDDTPAASTVVAADVDPLVLQALSTAGIEEPWKSRLAPTADLATIRAWTMYAEQTDTLTNPAGFIVAQLRTGAPPPVDLVTLARLSNEHRAWLDQHLQHRNWYDEWEHGLPVDLATAEAYHAYRKAQEKDR